MRIVGGISLVVAMLFVWATIGMAVQTAHLQHQVDGFSSWEKAAQEWTGVARQNQAQIEGSQIGAGLCFLGAVMTGGLGVVLIGLSFVKKGGTKS